MKKVLFFFILLFGSVHTSSLWARHIIGGEITYVCTGNGNYNFTMNVYRDCDSGGAEFDDPARVTIYQEINGTYSGLVTLSVPLMSVSVIPPPTNPCSDIPDICVEGGLYRFSRSLPISATVTYHIVYQRCCRNNTIANLNDPRSQGATYTVAISPDAQTACNNSPTFDNFPPTVICAGESIDFDHSATDIDGDQLVYSFCSPIQGGGLEGSDGVPGTPSGCEGVAPDPACPPPFNEVFFAFPTYSPQNPMGGNPRVTIDPNTGLINGVPNVLGQFVVGVCVQEFRNGVLLSTISRDFQFNVTTCTPLVAAIIAADSIDGMNNAYIISCGNSQVNFVNQSIQRSNIVEFYWEIDTNNDGTAERFTEWEPSINFPGEGDYFGRLILNPGFSCDDTADIFISILPEIFADFSSSYDTCVAGPVTFTDASFSDAGPNTITDWFWDFGDSNTSTEQNPQHDYQIPGNFPVSLTVTDINGCEITETIETPYFPAPAVIIVEPNTFLGCLPAEITFSNLSIPIDSTYDIRWTFGDGETSNDISPVHTYQETGTYDVTLEITSPIGCFVTDSFPNWITVLPSPVAGFTFQPTEVDIFNNTVTFTDESIEPASWYWIFGEQGFSSEQNPMFTLPDTGIQAVTLLVTHNSGCTDTLTQFLDIKPVVKYFLPNAFTPNFDDLNDEFVGVGIFAGMLNFQMNIWNRWGEQVFATNDPTAGWNGKKNNSGKLSPNGVYVYHASYVGPRGEFVELRGFATLVK